MTPNPNEKRRNRRHVLTVEEVLSPSNLDKVWRAIRGAYEPDLLRDPLDLLAFEAHLESSLKQLAHLTRIGEYRPAAQVIVRAAKGDGMTRPLSFLDITDTIVLKAITDALQANLHGDFPTCVGFSRSKVRSMRESAQDYESWIQSWLRHQGIVQDVLQAKGCEYVVQCDISNFFASIDHRLLRQCVLSRGEADERLANLLFFVLESMLIRTEYREGLDRGIPQENYDTSRILAHGFLHHVDKAFQKEIDEGRYARWVDDFVVAVRDKDEGRRVLNRLQKALEGQGLHPNSGKCAIRTCRQFDEFQYPQLNDYLDHVHKVTQSDGEIDPGEARQFDSKLLCFLEQKRVGHYERVLRRFYTQARRIGSSVLEPKLGCHLTEFPASAQHMLGYVLGRPFHQGILDQVLDYLDAPANMYEDVEIRIYELLLDWCVAPGQESTTLAGICLDHFFGRNGRRAPSSPYARGQIALITYKYGNSQHLQELVEFFCADHVQNPLLAQYLLAVLAGTDYRDQAFAKAERLEDRNTRRLHSILTSLRRDPTPYAPMLRRHARVIKKTCPRRVYFPARMLPIAKLVRCDVRFRPQWDAHLRGQIDALDSGNGDLKDLTSIKRLRDEVDRA